MNLLCRCMAVLVLGGIWSGGRLAYGQGQHTSTQAEQVVAATDSVDGQPLSLPGAVPSAASVEKAQESAVTLDETASPESPDSLTLPPVKPRKLLTTRNFLGVGFLGGSLLMVKQAIDYKGEADDLYDKYKEAEDPIEIDRLYQRTTNRDVKSQVSWALSAAFAISGVRLLLTHEVEPPERQLKIGALQLHTWISPHEAKFAVRKALFN